MSKSIVLGNGNIHVGLNEKGLLSDFYFPYVGLENQVQGDLFHRLGIYVDGKYSSICDGSWSIDINLKPHTLVSDIHYSHNSGIELESNDAVYNDKNIFLKRLTIKNTTDSKKEVRIFFSQVFGLYGSTFQDTAYFDPERNVLIHYEGRRIFLIYAEISDTPFNDYSVGLYMTEGKEGTFKDAEDGVLSKNDIEHGQVDSTMGLICNLESGESKEIKYWIAVAETKAEVYELHSFIKYKGFDKLMQDTSDYWNAWIKRNAVNYKDLPEQVSDLYEKSMFYIRAHIDNRGAIIASGDSSILNYGRDTYGYMWPRDGALTVTALLLAGEYSVSKRFFKFCNDVQEEAGYMMHKYRPDRSLGSSWHPYIKDGKNRLPIQEDETALVLIALRDYYDKTKEIEFIEQHYADFVHRAGMFLATYINEETLLPLPSYDLWEEKYAISTYTSATVYAGLLAASDLASLLGKSSDGVHFKSVATAIKTSILKYLYLPEKEYFCKSINQVGLDYIYDEVLDISSIYGIFTYGILDIDDPRVEKTINKIERELLNKNGIGGVPRYTNDEYFTQSKGRPNPWYICTLWLAQYYILKAKTIKDLESTKSYFDWVSKYTPKSGVMSEQLHAVHGTALSATPLTWSHAEFIRTVHMYIDKFDKLA